MDEEGSVLSMMVVLLLLLPVLDAPCPPGREEDEEIDELMGSILEGGLRIVRVVVRG